MKISVDLGNSFQARFTDEEEQDYSSAEVIEHQFLFIKIYRLP